jgi:predicted nucleic-acid-binding protein
VIGLDTNILVRFLTHDDPKQTPVAIDIITNRVSEDVPGFVSLVTLAETAWVLDRIYGLDKRKIGEAMRSLAQLPAIRLQSEAEAMGAIVAAQRDGADIPDVLIATLGLTSGCMTTLTFDRKASRLPGFELAT